MKRNKNFVIGLVVVGAIIIFVWGLNFLKGNNLFSSEQIYYAKYSRVDGLVQSSAVTLKGLKVGQIKSIRFIDNGNNLLVEFSVTKPIDFPKNTIAHIVSADIMGTKQLKLVLGNSTQKLHSGDTLIGETEGGLKEQVSMQMLPIKQKAEKLMSSLDSVLSVIQYIFNNDTRNNLRNSIGSIDQTFSQLKSTAATLNKIITEQQTHLSNTIINVDSITYNLKNNNKNISHILNKFASISDSVNAEDIGKTFAHFRSSMQSFDSVLDKVNKGEGSLGHLLIDDSLYNNLIGASHNLNSLFQDIQNNPKKYVHFSIFGTGKKMSKNNMDTKQVMYAIQILSSSQKIDTNSKIFKNYKNIEVVFQNNTYRYIIHKNRNQNKIIRKLKKIKRDFPKAFVVKITEG